MLTIGRSPNHRFVPFQIQKRGNNGKSAYIDEQLLCADCKKGFVFSAKEQRFWYERLSLTLKIKPTRCVRCRWANRVSSTG